MAEAIGSAGSGHPNLNLNTEERRAYGQLLKEADPDGFGAVSGDVAVKFFERTKLAPDVLGQIWQIADTENRGFLTPAGFGIVLRLIGHAQAGRTPTAQLATQPAPLPKFDASPTQAPPPPQALQQPAPPASPSQTGQPPIRVPALSPEKVGEYSMLFERSGPDNGSLPGPVAKQIFERARLPNEVLGRIWGLSDTQGRGSLDMTEFTIAMHLLASYKSGQMRGVPNSLPPGLYEAASRRAPPRGPPPSQPFQPQVTGFSGRPQSPIVRQQMGTPLSAQSTGEGWLISPADKARFDSIFATVDRQNRGFITGDQAIEFFGNARLPEEVLAQIWDLADINSEGQLNRDEFAVAMYLIRQQRGTKDGRGNLPQVLPPALMPPSMRKQQIAPSQPTAPAFENAPITKPRSAADDLFGLDAFGPTPPAQQQIAQSTGGTDAGPFANPASSTASPATQFKPFIPSSTFGQSLNMPPQATGPQASSQSRSVSDDLLGDADPDVSSKLTNETSELANLSNQVGNLSKQMNEVQTKRGQTGQELSQNTTQKRAFESRLAQLRSMYENEVKEVKTLQEQLTASRNDTKRLQQDMAVIEGSHQDLSAQHQQIRTAFETDQRENAALKERMRQLNTEVEQLKPQLEKLKSDARQQKGLVAINKKQLQTNEGERDRIKAEIAAAHKQIEDAAREAEESARQLEASKRELEEARKVPIPTAPAVKSPPPVVSPAPSTSSNPFFRRGTGDGTFSPYSPPTAPAAAEQQADNRNAFDSIFGPSFGTAAAGPAPAASFKTEAPAPAPAPAIHEPSATRSTDSPASSAAPDVSEPPAPAQSNQITSAALPFRQPLSRGDSISSSVRVAPPASRLSPADTPRAMTPSSSTDSPKGQKQPEEDPFGVATPDEEQESVRRTLPTGSAPSSDHGSVTKLTEDKSGDIPGAFPGTETPRAGTPAQNAAPIIGLAAGAATVAAGAGLATAALTNGANDKGKAPAEQARLEDNAGKSNFDDFFGGPAHQRTPSEQAADFDSAFANMKPSAEANGKAQATDNEFPAIQEMEDDDDSSDYSDETPLGFDDDFSKSSQQQEQPASATTGKEPEVASAVPAGLRPPRPGFETASSTASSLPGFDQQTSPPGYKDVIPNDNPSHFPREYKGLLPEREDPTSPPPVTGGSSFSAPDPAGSPPSYGPEVGHATNTASISSVGGPPSYAPETGHSTRTGSSPPAGASKSSPFDFDFAFADVKPAQVEDESDEDDAFRPSQNRAPEFDPTFDSPSHSRATTATSNAAPSMTYNQVTNGPASPQTSSYQGFSTVPSSSTTQPGQLDQSGVSSTSHDWDDIFSGLGSGTGPSKDTTGFGDERSSAAPASISNSPPQGIATSAAQADFRSGPATIPASAPAPTYNAPPTTVPAPVPAPTYTAPAATKIAAPSTQVAPALPSQGARPTPGRALSQGTEHDDPILKRLTAMGWSRDESLKALEKYDYNIDKAADYLTFQS